MIVPSAGAFTSSSIFIDSTIITVSPFLTFAPLATTCLSKVPATGAFTSVPPDTTGAAAGAALAAGVAVAATGAAC